MDGMCKFFWRVMDSMWKNTSVPGSCRRSARREQKRRGCHSLVPLKKTAVKNPERETTPPKFNMEPENDGFQKESPFPGLIFRWTMLNFRGVAATKKNLQSSIVGDDEKYENLSATILSLTFSDSAYFQGWNILVSRRVWGAEDVFHLDVCWDAHGT